MILKIGHRGARAYETENTLESFRKAIRMGATAIELDVRMSKDRKLVVIHDDNLKKVFGKDIAVKEATLAKLRESTDGKIPTLEEALHFINGKVEKILVELKEPGYEKNVLEVIRKEGLEEKVIVVSFHEEALERMRKLNAKIETGLIYARYKNPTDAALRLKARYLVALYRFVHTRDVEKAHEKNLKVIVWTINTKDEVKKYFSKGVDGIATDKPDIFQST